MTPSYRRMAPFSSYVALVRGVLVDFGFGSLIEKFEERFGRRVTTVLLAIVGVGIVAACVGVIASNLIKPAVDLYNNANWPGFKKWLFESLVPTLVSLGILYIFAILLSFVWTEIYRRTWARRKKRKEVEAWVERAMADHAVKLRAQMTQLGSELEAEITAQTHETKERIFDELRNAMAMRDKAQE